MALEPIDLLKERLSEMKQVDCKQENFVLLKKYYELTIDFLELYNIKKPYTCRKLSDKDIKRIKRLLKHGNAAKLSYQYNISTQSISFAKKNKLKPQYK